MNAIDVSETAGTPDAVSLTMRFAEPDDADAISALLCETGAAEPALRVFTKGDGRMIVLATPAGELAAVASTRIDDKGSHLSVSIVVVAAPLFQGLGLEERVAERWAALCRTYGIEAMGVSPVLN